MKKVSKTKRYAFKIRKKIIILIDIWIDKKINFIID
jgi:hypothetical protein